MTSFPDVCDGQPECELSGEAMLPEVKSLVEQGNIRRLTIKGPNRRTLIEVPLRLGSWGAPLEPIWAALSALASTSKQFAVAVQREDSWPRRR